jgi:drug/metabolite transporter (DMT)-like permease
MANAGQVAALMTSLFYSFSSTFFTFATRQFGPMVVNRLRLVMAAVLLILVHQLLFGSSLPFNAGASRWFWLGISGIVGLVLGDALLFQAYRYIGPRLAMPMMSLAPIIAALVAWLFLGETLGFIEIIGIFVTIGGLAWVVNDGNGSRKNNAAGLSSRDYKLGLLFGLGAATGQALGLVLSKRGMVGNFSAISGNVIRMVTAAIFLWVITFFQGQARPTIQQLSLHPRSIWFIGVGMLAGPILGVSLSLYAVQNANVGIASTLMALPPVFLLPIGYFVFKERFSWSAIAGTVVALVGVAILFLK